MINDIQTLTPGPGHEQYLRFQCGSTYTDMMFRTGSRVGSGSQCRKKMCPECSAKLTNKIFYCVDCCEWFLGTKSTSHKRVRCSVCAAERKKKSRAATWRNRDKTKETPVRKYVFKKVQKPSPVKSDCKFYLPDCLPRAAFAPNGGGKVYCENCIYYKSEPMHATADGRDRKSVV